MKKFILYLMLFTGLISFQMETNAQSILADFKTKGKISSDDENVYKETDPIFTAMPFDPAVHKKKSQTENLQVSQLEHGKQIITGIVNKLIIKEYGFSLLSSHKYMVNDCLGLKVSSGQFDLRFSNPKIELTNSGQFKITLKIDKIKFSAFKVRMKPRTPDFSDPNPCHFSGKFEIGGEATDISVTVTLSLVTGGLEGSAGFCFFAFDNTFSIKWNIGGFNLKPFPNSLDNVAKEMVEDALNTGMDGILYSTFIQLSKEVIPQYYQACEEVYNSGKIVKAVSGAITDTETKGKTKDATDKWVITPVPTMKGVLGRLDINFPADVERSILIYQATDNKFLRSVSRNDKIYTIAPGLYRFTLTNVPVDNVPIQKGHETRLKAGFLNVVSEGDWHLYNDTKEKQYTSGNKPKKLPLPIGSYQLKLGGQFYPFIIKDGETVEY